MPLKNYKIIDGKIVESADQECPISVFLNPADDEKRFLIDQLKIDEYDVNSAFDPNELARVEFEPGYTAIIIKQPKRYSSNDEFLLKVFSIGIFLVQGRLIILLANDVPMFEGRSFSRVKSIPDLFLKIIYRCIIHFEEHLAVIHSISDELEQKINKSMANKYLLEMFNLEKSLVYYLKAIGANSKVVEKIRVNSSKFGFSPEENEFLEDVIIENNQCYEQASTYSQVLSNLMDAWASIINNNLNIFIKTLTLVMISLMVPTLILNIFSMNVKMPFDQVLSTSAFWGIVTAATISAGAVWALLRYKKW